MERVKQYIWDTKAISKYALTRNDLLGSDYSSKLSPWLSSGCVSIRYLYHQVKEFEKKHKSN